MDSKLKEKIEYFEQEIKSFRELTTNVSHEVEYTEMREFQILLAAVHSLIKHNNFTEIMLKDASGAPADKEVVRENLSKNFGIIDDGTSTLNIGNACFRGCHWQLGQFNAVNDEKFSEQFSKMPAAAKENFLKCKEFSDALIKISPTGYLGWDISLGVDLVREALFCDYCNQPFAEKVLDDVTKPLLKMYDNWTEYAVSFVIGGTYAAYKNSKFNIDETVSNFDYLLGLVNRLFTDSTVDVWRAFSWFKPKVYFPTIDKENLKNLVDTEQGCFVSDRISVDGEIPCFIYREEPFTNFPDSGWRFFAGDESKEYSSDVSKSNMFPLNVMANYDQTIIPLLGAEINSAFIRKQGEDFIDFKTVSDALKDRDI